MKNYQKIISLLLTVIIVVSIFTITPVSASAAETDIAENGVTSGITGDCSWTLEDTELTISGNGEMGDFDFWHYPAPWRTDITKVTITDGVRNIGEQAFRECSSLTSVSIPASVTSIGYRTFYGCTGLTSIDIPDSVTSIGNNAFEGCMGLTSIDIPPLVTSIGNYAFTGCTGLKSLKVSEGNSVYDSRNNCNAIIETESNTLITGCMNSFIPASVTSIGDYAFFGNTELISIDIPASVTWISESAFDRCTGLTSVDIPNSVTWIGGGAFFGCTGLTSIGIPNSVTDIGYDAFGYYYDDSWNTRKVPDFTIYGYTGTVAEEYANDNGFAFVSLNDDNPDEADYEYRVLNDGTAEITRYKGTDKNITIPNKLGTYTVSSIGVSAFTPIEDENFNLVTNIETVVIPDTVKSIGMLAFADCTKLTGVVIPDGVESIEAGAFQGCSKLDDISLPNGISCINPWMFMNCSSLSSIEIPNTVTTIGWRAFENCSSLESITIPDSVTSLEEGGTFSGCVNLKKAVISDRLTSIPSRTFFGCQNLNRVIVSNTVTAIESDAFFGCTNLNSITLSQNIESIADGSLGYYRNNSYELKKVNDYAIYGYRGTEAERYANENDFIFIALDNIPKSGDADGDGEVTSFDVTLVQRYDAFMDTGINEDVLMNADVDGSGELEIIDATFIQRYLAYMDIPYTIGEIII